MHDDGPTGGGPVPGDGPGRPRARLPDLGRNGEGWVVIQVALFAVVFAAGFGGPAWSGVARAVTTASGIALMGIGAAAVLLGVLGLREQLTPFPRPPTGGRLVDTGIFGVVRHPIYTGIVAAAAGWALVMASPAALGAGAFLLLFFDLKSRREEAWLVDAYPGYAAYRRRVRKLIPFLY